MKKLGIQIKQIRDKNNLSQERFGSKIGVTGKTISSYETGRSTPPLKVLEKISEVYSIPIVSLKSEDKNILDQMIINAEKVIQDIKEIVNRGISI